jgi:myo-inositol 2-dehydrogenase/D-chiro-inositol 1-dehydrogenase
VRDARVNREVTAHAFGTTAWAFGVGGWAEFPQTLVRLHQDDLIELAAIGDRHLPTLSANAMLINELGGVSVLRHVAEFTDADAMADARGVDAVVIASRTADHTRDARGFVRRGIPVLLEKPMAASIAEAAAFCRELGDRGSHLVQIGFQRHYDDAGRTALAWVQDGRIGALQQTHHVIQDKNPTPEGYQSTGITADMAIHLVFEAMSFRNFALPRSVQALRFLAPHYEDRAHEGANVVHVFCTWADGSIAHLGGSRINATGYDNRFSLVGTEGRIDVGDFAGDFGAVTAKLWRGTGGEPRGQLVESLEFPMTPPASRHPDFYPRFAAAYANEVREFVARVEQGTALEPGPDIGWKTLFVANLAEASSRLDGRRFDLAARRRADRRRRSGRGVCGVAGTPSGTPRIGTRQAVLRGS